MPRRSSPDPLAAAVGRRIAELRKQAGLTLERLAYESELGSKGHLSDVEKGRAIPNVVTLKKLADGLGVDLLDLVTFPGDSPRQALVDRTRTLAAAATRRLLRDLQGAAPKA